MARLCEAKDHEFFLQVLAFDTLHEGIVAISAQFYFVVPCRFVSAIKWFCCSRQRSKGGLIMDSSEESVCTSPPRAVSNQRLLQHRDSGCGYCASYALS